MKNNVIEAVNLTGLATGGLAGYYYLIQTFIVSFATVSFAIKPAIS